MLDGGNGTNTPNVLETWECYGCYLEATNWQDLKYSEQTAAMIDLTIRFDNAVQTTGGGLGASPSVQRNPGGTNALGS
jgi:hypothetical protein